MQLIVWIEKCNILIDSNKIDIQMGKEHSNKMAGGDGTRVV